MKLKLIHLYACFVQPPENIQYAALVIGGSFLIEGTNHGITDLDCWTASANNLLCFSIHIFPYNESWSSLGASLVVAIHAVRKGAAAEGMRVRDYVWRGHDPTSVAVMTEVIFSSPMEIFVN